MPLRLQHCLLFGLPLAGIFRQRAGESRGGTLAWWFLSFVLGVRSSEPALAVAPLCGILFMTLFCIQSPLVCQRCAKSLYWLANSSLFRAYMSTRVFADLLKEAEADSKVPQSIRTYS